MKRIFLLLLCCVLTACGSENTVAPSSSKNVQPAIEQGPSQVKEFKVINSGFREHQGLPAAWVMFSKPVNQHLDIAKYIKLSDKNGLLDGGWQLDKNAKNAYYINILPAHDYKIEVAPELTSIDDQPLIAASEQSFTSPDISAAAIFLQQGSILNPDVSDGLPVMVVNLPWLDLDFYRVKPKYYLSTLANKPSSNFYAWSTENLTKHATLVSSQKYDTKALTNKKVRTVLRTEHIEAIKQPGLYVAVMRAPSQYEQYQVAYFNVSTLGTEVREYKDNYLVTVIEQNSGQAAASVEVIALDRHNKQLGKSLLTNSQGQVTFAKTLKPALLSINRATDFNLLRLRHNNPLDLRDFDQVGRENLNLELFIFGPRDLYRRGETIKYYALLRDLDGKPVKHLPIPASLIDPAGNEIASALTTVKAGLYQFNHRFNQDALTGKYNLRFTIGEQVYQHTFSVEDFMPQRLEITLQDNHKTLQQPGVSNQALTGLFLYGAPASAHKSDGLLQIKTTDSAVDQLPGYFFGQHQDLGTLDSYPIDAITLDKSGQGQLTIEDRWSQFNQALSLQGYAYLYETGGRKVSKKFSQLWWPQPTLIGIKPSFDKLTSASNQQVSFKILRSDLKGKLQGDHVMVSLIRHHQEFYWQHNKQSGWQRLERNDVYPVWQQELTLTDAQALVITAPVEWGKYQLVVSSTVDKSKASLFFNAGEAWYWRWAENNGNSVRPDQIKLALDKNGYQVGDTATVKIDAPYAGQAWLRIESDELLWQQQVALKQGQNSLEFPIKDWQRHDLYLSAYLIAPATKTTAPQRALGLTHLVLDRTNRALSITLDAAPKVKPDQLINVNAKVANAGDNTRVILAAVDVGILNLHQFNTPDPAAYFFAKRQYSVDIRDNFNQIIAPNQLNKADVLWGGGAELARGGQQASANVQIVSYLSAPQLVDQQGITHFEVPVPYFNGRLRLFAIAFDQQRFGSTEQPLTVAADLVTQMNMPRFLAVGDHANLALDLTNTTDQQLDFTLELATSGLAFSTKPQKISLAPQQKLTLTLEVTATTVTPNAQINLNIHGNNLTINRQWQLAVRPAYPAQRRSNSVVLAPNQLHQFKLDNANWGQQIQSSISIASRPQFDLNEQVSKLYQFPLGCLEQTTSRLLPWLVLPPVSQQQLTEQLGNIDRNQLINDGVKRILSLQTYNGALSLWSSNGDENPWLSVYGAQALLQAQQNGIYVTPVKLEKLLTRLSHYLRRGNFNSHGDGEDYRFATRAYAALVLAKLGRANQSHMRQLMKSMGHSKSPYPLVQLAAAFKLMGDNSRSSQLINSAMSLKFPIHYSANYTSNIRDKAMVISLLLEHDLALTWGQKLSFELWQDIKSRHWFSTQERLALVLADSQLAQHFDHDFDYTLQIAASEFKGPDQVSAFYRVDGAALNDSNLRNTSTHPLYINTISQGYPINPPAYQADGLTIRRDYYDLSGQAIAIKQVNSGQRLIVRIRVHSKLEQLKDVMVVDLLPAGFEIEQGTLGDQLDLEQLTIEGHNITALSRQENIDYQGYRDDRYIAAISVNSYRETELFYLVQAVTPGEYRHPPVMAQGMYRDDIRAVGEASELIPIK